MLSISHLEPENTETTPLVALSNRREPLSRRKKAERVARLLGRVFNPVNDMAIAGLSESVVATYYTFYKRNTLSSNTLYILFGISALVGVLSLGSELIASYRLSKNTPFILGENYYEHAKILTQKLKTLLDTQTVNASQRHFDQWIIELKQSSQSESVNKLIKDFEKAVGYNRFRAVIDNISTLILTEGVPTCIVVSFTFDSLPIVIAGSTILAIIFLMKACFDKIDYNWYQYENSWKKLPLSLKRTLVTLRSAVDGTYFYMLGMSAFTYSFCTYFLPFSGTFQQCPPSSTGNIFVAIAATSLSAISTVIELIPEHRCCVKSDTFRHIKRGNQGIVHGLKITALLGVLGSLIIATFKFPNTPLPFLIIPLIAALIIAVNTALNYQEPDPNKMSTASHDVAKLRKEIVDIKKGLLQNQNEDDMIDAMHDKSEMDDIISNAETLENTTQQDKKSYWGSLSSFWKRSENQETTQDLSSQTIDKESRVYNM